MKLIPILIAVILLANCGFKPMYKIDGSGIGLDELSVKFDGSLTYEIKEELEALFDTKSGDKNYIVTIEVKEELVPVIVNENGTVSKYQIDIALFFTVTNKANEILVNDVSIGFAQYDVQVSEISNEDLRKQMLRSATSDAAGLMITKIQSKLSSANDN